MKRTLIALAVTAAVAAPLAAQAAPKVYGKLNLSVENIDDDTKASDRWEVVSNASRFGVKGEDELTATLSAVYQIEWEVSADGNSGTDLGQRNRFLGIKSQSLGTVKLGKYDTYLKLAQGEIDQFNDLNADLGKVLTGENRVNNVIGYESPKFLDALTFNVMVVPGEESGNKSPTPPATPAAKGAVDDNGLVDYLSTSLVYSNEDLGLYAAVAYDQNVVSTFNAVDYFGTAPAYTAGVSNGTLKADKSDVVRLVASYTLKDLGLTLGGLYQTAERSDGATVATVANVTPEETGYVLSAALKLAEVWTAKAQYAASSTQFSGTTLKDVDLTQTSLGVDYAFASKTKAFAYYSIRNASNSNNNPAATNGKTTDYDLSFLGLGLEHKF